jgi:CheY-like chemotaxis protein
MTATMLAPRTVLVVDDDEDVRDLAVSFLEALGLIALQAADAPEALRLLAEHPEVRVLFSDVRMPGMNGVELATEARRRWPHLNVVLTSGYVGGATVQDVEFVPKPYRVSDVEKAICRTFG